MVFAHDEIIPTLLRASLLENLLPTTPVQTSYVASMGVEKIKEQISNLPSQHENIVQFSRKNTEYVFGAFSKRDCFFVGCKGLRF